MDRVDREANVTWIMLYAAIAFEVAGTTALKLSEGLEKVLFFAGALALYGVSFMFLTLALKTVPVSVAYAIWSGWVRCSSPSSASSYSTSRPLHFVCCSSPSS
jgi:hypothetical protein